MYQGLPPSPSPLPLSSSPHFQPEPKDSDTNPFKQLGTQTKTNYMVKYKAACGFTRYSSL